MKPVGGSVREWVSPIAEEARNRVVWAERVEEIEEIEGI
jgi:hypothetical protein